MVTYKGPAEKSFLSLWFISGISEWATVCSTEGPGCSCWSFRHVKGRLWILWVLCCCVWFVCQQNQRWTCGWPDFHIITVKKENQIYEGHLCFSSLKEEINAPANKICCLLIHFSVSLYLSLSKQLPKSIGCVLVTSWRCVSFLLLKPWRPNCPECPTQRPKTTRPCCAL